MKGANKRLVFFVSLLLSLAACSSVPEKVEQNYNLESAQADATVKQMTPAVKLPQQKIYLGPQQAETSDLMTAVQLPAVFNKSFNLYTPNPVSISEIAAMLTDDYGLRLYVEPEAVPEIGAVDGGIQSLDGSRPQTGGADSTGSGGGASGGAQVARSAYRIPVMYSGTVKGLLDMITTRANVFWKWDSGTNEIDIFRTDIKHFEIRALAIAYDVDANVSNTSGTSVESSSGGASGVSGGGSSSENTAMKAATMDVWKSIVSDVKSMLSPDGTISAADSVGYITVKDTPARLAQVESYVHATNRRLSRMVAVRVDVIDVTSDDANSYGIDWNAVYTKANSYGLNLVTDTIAGAIPNSLTGTVLQSSSSRWSSSQAMLAALSTQGDVALKTTETIQTQSGMPAPVKVAKETVYLQSVTNASTNVSTTASVQQGVVTAGTNMMVLPFVQDDGNVLVQLSMDISTLDGITTFTTGGTTVQQPHLSVKDFIERVNVSSGNTIVVSGFQQVQDNNSYNGITPNRGWFWWLGGTRSREHRKVTTVLLITPYIIKS